MHELIPNKTYIFTNDGVKILKSIKLQDDKIILTVYDRMYENKSQILNLSEINHVLTKHTNEYNKLIKNFLIYLGKNLAPQNKHMYDLIIALWNKDCQTVSNLIYEYTGLEEEMQDYFRSLFNSEHNIAARLFEEILYNQEFAYYTCPSEKDEEFLAKLMSR